MQRNTLRKSTVACCPLMFHWIFFWFALNKYNALLTKSSSNWDLNKNMTIIENIAHWQLDLSPAKSKQCQATIYSTYVMQFHAVRKVRMHRFL